MTHSSEITAHEGYLPFKVDSVDRGCRTFYKIIGDLSCGSPPLVCLHGGPGGTHGGLLAYSEMWTRHRIPVVLYDQIGAGASTHLPELAGNESFWQVSPFIAQLDSLLDGLRLRDNGFYLLGHSFGAVLAADFATTQPRGLRKLILSSGYASKELSAQGQELRRKELPPAVQNTIDKANAAHDFENEEYIEAVVEYLHYAMCRADSALPMLRQFVETLKENTVLTTMNGPSLTLGGQGSMRDWTVIPRLHRISVPTLIWNGEYDTQHDIAVQPFFDLIPHAKWITFPKASHSPLFEGPELRETVLRTAGDFLSASDDVA
ncbi:hypothetical protein ANO11243_066850 [Dothideomycetidae sp. 11243]|nr:hypothetical protein ANO11243_066850 [fungal sp. No.11243]